MKKVLTLLLALALVVCMIPASAVTAFAEGETGYTVTLDAASVVYNGQSQLPVIKSVTYTESEQTKTAAATEYTVTYNKTTISSGDSGQNVTVGEEVTSLVDVGTYQVTVTEKNVASSGTAKTGTAQFAITALPITDSSIVITKNTIADTLTSTSEAITKEQSGLTFAYNGDSNRYNNTIFAASNLEIKVKSIDSTNKIATLTVTGRVNLSGTKEVEVPQATGLTGGNGGNTTIAAQSTMYYTGKAQNVNLKVTYTNSNGAKTVLTQGTDYTVSPTTLTDSAKTPITITGKGKYAGTVTESNLTYIQPKATSNSSNNGITIESIPALVQGTTTYDVVVKDTNRNETLTKGTDYVQDIPTTNVGTNTATITFNGNYSGERTLTYNVVKSGYDLSKAKVTIYDSKSSWDYDGSSHKFSDIVVKIADPNNSSKTLTLTSGTDYTVTYEYENTKGKTVSTTSPTTAAYYDLVITGKGDWGGKYVDSSALRIYAYSVSKCTITVSATSATRKPSVTVRGNGVTFTEGTDYEISDWYASSDKKTMYATVRALSDGNLTGSKTQSTSLSSKYISSCDIYFTNGKSSAVYTGSTISAPVTVKDGKTTLTQGTDYTVTIKNDAGTTVSSIKNTGTYTIEITGKNGYTGSDTLKFTVTGSTQYITGLDDSYKVYPNGTVQLYAKATEGTVTYSSSDTSIATVSSTGLVTAIKAGRAKITVKTVGNTKYEPATSSTVIKVYPTKGVLTKKPWKANGKVKVRWNKQDNVTYYQVRYSRNKSFAAGTYLTKKVTAAENIYTTQSTSLTGLKSGAKYYVKVRAVKEVYNDNGKKLTYYGKWSNWRSVRA